MRESGVAMPSVLGRTLKIELADSPRVVSYITKYDPESYITKHDSPRVVNVGAPARQASGERGDKAAVERKGNRCKDF